MHERNFYAARPISTYGTSLGEDYLKFLSAHFRQVLVIDPDGPELKAQVQAIKDEYPDHESYNKYGASKVMEIFAAFTKGMHGGAGFILPVEENDTTSFKVPAGIAKELATIHGNGFPTWIVTCRKYKNSNELLLPYAFEIHQITDITEVEVPSTEKEGKETIRVFVTLSSQFPKAFHQLSIQETRERVYYWPDRKRMRPYFLEDAEPSAV